MEPFKKIKSIVTPLDKVNVDTDQIIPKQFLKLVQKTGFGQYLFYDWRFENGDKPREDFILNNPNIMIQRYCSQKTTLGVALAENMLHGLCLIMDLG